MTNCLYTQMERVIWNGFLKYIEDDMEAIDRGGNTYEVIQKGYSKATACEFTMEKTGDSEGESLCIWRQQQRSVLCLSMPATRFAMGVHSPVLDPYTEYVTSRVEENGIANALKHYGLI